MTEETHGYGHLSVISTELTPFIECIIPLKSPVITGKWPRNTYGFKCQKGCFPSHFPLSASHSSCSEVCLNEDAIWPVRVHAVIVSPQSHSVPMLISVTLLGSTEKRVEWRRGCWMLDVDVDDEFLFLLSITIISFILFVVVVVVVVFVVCCCCCCNEHYYWH